MLGRWREQRRVTDAKFLVLSSIPLCVTLNYFRFLPFFHVRAFLSFSKTEENCSFFSFSRALFFQEFWLLWNVRDYISTNSANFHVYRKDWSPYVDWYTHGFSTEERGLFLFVIVVASIRRVFPRCRELESNSPTPYSWVFKIRGYFWERYCVISYSYNVINL